MQVSKISLDCDFPIKELGKAIPYGIYDFHGDWQKLINEHS
jgi:hypothetical protein